MAQAMRPKRRTGEFGGRGRFTPRRKVCMFCVDKIDEVDYKDIARLRRFLSDRGKIEPRRKTGTCATHQRSLNVALKRARHLALLPFTAEHIRITGIVLRDPSSSFRGGPRGPRPFDGDRDGRDGRDGPPSAAPTPDGAAATTPDAAAAQAAPPAAEAAPSTQASQGTAPEEPAS